METSPNDTLIENFVTWLQSFRLEFGRINQNVSEKAIAFQLRNKIVWNRNTKKDKSKYEKSET